MQYNYYSGKEILSKIIPFHTHAWLDLYTAYWLWNSLLCSFITTLLSSNCGITHHVIECKYVLVQNMYHKYLQNTKYCVLKNLKHYLVLIQTFYEITWFTNLGILHDDIVVGHCKIAQGKSSIILCHVKCFLAVSFAWIWLVSTLIREISNILSVTAVYLMWVPTGDLVPLLYKIILKYTLNSH